MIPKLGMFFFCCYLREISLIRITKIEVLTLLKSVASLFVYPGFLWNSLNYIPSPCVYVMLTVRSSCDRSSCRRLAMLSAVPWRELVQLNDVVLPFGHTALWLVPNQYVDVLVAAFLVYSKHGFSVYFFTSVEQVETPGSVINIEIFIERFWLILTTRQLLDILFQFR